MAKALTFRQLAKNFQKQADLYSRLAKLQNQQASAASQTLPADSDPGAPAALQAVIGMFDLAVRSFYTSDGQQQQADAANAAADAAGEPA